MTPDDDVSPHVRLRIDKSTKRDWLEYVEESEYSTLTDLIKTSVSNTIDGKWVLASKHENDDPGVSAELADTLNGIDDRVNALQDQIDQAELGHADTGPEMSEQELMSLSHHCHDNLPPVQDSDHLLSLTLPHKVTLEPSERPKITGTAQDIGNYLGESVSDVRRALIYLERQETASVESIIDDGTRRWYQIDETAERGPPSSLEIEDAVEHDVEIVTGSDINDDRDL